MRGARLGSLQAGKEHVGSLQYIQYGRAISQFRASIRRNLGLNVHIDDFRVLMVGEFEPTRGNFENRFAKSAFSGPSLDMRDLIT